MAAILWYYRNTCYNTYLFSFSDDMEVTPEPDFDVGELSSTGRQLEVALGGAVQLACPPGIFESFLQSKNK